MTILAVPQLEYRTCVVQVERALVERLALAFKERLPPVKTKAALRGLSARSRYPQDLVFVEEIGRCVAWTPANADPDDNAHTFAPLEWHNATTGKLLEGRWVRCANDSLYATREMTDVGAKAIPLSAYSSGYLRSVELYQGRPDTDALFQRFTGRRPLLAVRYAGDTRKRLNSTSALYRVEMEFQLIGLSFHPRRGAEALEGSDLPREARLDPGLFKILGDADDCAQGQSHPESGLYHLVPGVNVVLPRSHQIISESQSQRLFVGAANITVICGVHRPDYDTAPFTSVGLTTQQVEAHRVAALSRVDAVLEGLHVEWPQSTLQVAPLPGRIRVGGEEFAVAPSVVTFAANSDTYRYVTAAGELRYQAVTAGSEPPETPADWLAVGKTTTDGTGVFFDEFLCATIFDADRRDIETVESGEDLP